MNVQGTDEFKSQVILCAADLGLDVKFYNQEMQDAFAELKKDYGRKNNEDKQLASFNQPNSFDKFDDLFGGDKDFPSGNEEDNIHESDTQFFAEVAASSVFASMHDLQSGNLDGGKGINKMLLPDAEESENSWNDSILKADSQKTDDDTSADAQKNIAEKRTVSAARINRAEKIVMDMLLAANGMVKGADHVAYINREEKFSSRGGCVFTDNHLPSWAKDAKDFFQEADRNERINGTRYREIEFALPNELDLEQQKEIINTFIDHHLKDFYYAYAVHEKIGALSDGQKHPHVHIMFSERKLDDYEKEHERERGLFFKRANKKEPEKGGCAKDEKFNGKRRISYLRYMREDFAKIQNNILAKNGYDITVDHRTLKAQREDALSRGDFYLAELLDRVPERSVGPIAAQNPNDKKVVELNKYRKLKEKKENCIYCQKILKDTYIDTISFNAIITMDKTIKLLEESKALFENSRYRYDDMLLVLKGKRNNIAKSYLATTFHDEALRKAMLKRMSSSDAEKYNRMTELMENKKNMQDFLVNYKEPDKDSESYAAYSEVKSSIEKQVNEYNKEITLLAKELNPVFKNLGTPTNKKVIQYDVIKTLEKSDKYKTGLEKSAKEAEFYDKRIKEIINYEQKRKDASAKIAQSEVPTALHSRSYSARQLLSYTYESKKLVMERMQTVIEEIKKASESHISETAARNMAVSIYTNGESKELNKERKALAKEDAALKVLLEELNEKADWKNIPAYHDEYAALETAYKKRLAWYTERLEKYESAKKALEIKCSTPEGKERINQITVKILSKNIINDQYYSNMKTELEGLKAKNADYKNQMEVLKKRVAADTKIMMRTKKNPKYSVSASAPIPAGKRDEFTPAILAGVLGGDENMASLSAYVKVDAGTARFLASGKTREEIEIEM